MKVKNILKNFVCICLLSLSVLFAPQVTYANDNIAIEGEQNVLSDGNFVYEFTEDGKALKVVKLAGASAKEIIIPNTRVYGGVEYPVKIIAENGLYLGMHGHTGENIEKITISANVEIIENSGLANLFNLETVVFEKNSKLHTIGDYAFYCCKKLKNVELPNAVTDMGKNAFFLCGKLEKVTLPAKLKEIKEGTFKSCSSLTSVNIPKNVTSIGKSAFEFCDSLLSVNISKGVTSVANSAFEGCLSLKDVTFNKGLKKIGERAFANCESIVRLELPSTLNSIGKSAFEYCTSLVSVNIPSKIKELKSKTFYGTAIRQISIPKNLKKISKDTFLIAQSFFLGGTMYVDVYASKDAYFYKNQKKFKGQGYEGYTVKFDFSTKKMPAYYKTSYYTNKGEFYLKYYSGTVREAYVTKYLSTPDVFREGYTFEGWYTKKTGGKKISSGTGEVKVTKDIKLYAHWKKAKIYTVGKYKFYITRPGEVAFAGVKSTKTTKVYIPETVKIKGKTYLVTSVAAKALKNKKKVTYIEVGENVKYIGAEAFKGCSKLAKIKFIESSGEYTALLGGLNLHRTGKDIFKGIKSNAQIYVPKNDYKDKVEELKNKGQGKKVKFKKY